ncbi:hypothetical protein [Pyrobaculum sp.]|uniref:hypothetical protein n=1 Tax=Pyrobaculum sp. TaxID=2004705 RepID=UPI003168A2DC
MLVKEISAYEKYGKTNLELRLRAPVKAHYCQSAVGASYKIVLDDVIIWHPYYLDGHEDLSCYELLATTHYVPWTFQPFVSLWHTPSYRVILPVVALYIDSEGEMYPRIVRYYNGVQKLHTMLMLSAPGGRWVSPEMYRRFLLFADINDYKLYCWAWAIERRYGSVMWLSELIEREERAVQRACV